MKVRIAFAAVVLALGVAAFTPTPAVAAGPSGVVQCDLGGENPFAIPFGGTGNPTLGEAVLVCINNLGGHPVGVEIDR